jgi:hypothetical protein
VYEVSGICVTEYDQDQDGLSFVNGDLFSISDAVQGAAGVESPPASVLSAAEFAETPYDDHRCWSEQLDAYRTETGRQWPPVYRVRVRVEAEALPEEEIARYWERQRATFMADASESDPPAG